MFNPFHLDLPNYDDDDDYYYNYYYNDDDDDDDDNNNNNSNKSYQYHFYKSNSMLLSAVFLVRVALLAAPAAPAARASSGVVLPLYVYPSAKFGDGAARWQPVLDAAISSPSVPWLIVVNPHNGPGLSGQPGDADQNYITGVSKLNAVSNIKTIGYVRTNYCTFSLEDLEGNVTAWSSWSSYRAANLSVHGIFFDESAPDLGYMTEAVGSARRIFGSVPITTVCNFGTAVAAEYYKICDVVVAFESCLNCSLGPQYKGAETLRANIPAEQRSRGAVIVHHFRGTAFDGSRADSGLVRRYLADAKKGGLGWAYFCSAGYDDVTAAPATVGEVAKGLA
ncbi:uncharacterized protein UV8b_03660 [Ustilaginoidea virens]|uniref:Cell surface spherulin 4-like protein n=2 Tax=Ustilaginoidea virens TaxID=1159556 RepID=A0A8E5HQ04_USTVR|nr:uncharacterized protein UV8b_03660 [Ustilaginoidea virens]QUC19419.1 hypothetical protein UV8b_03660 [Ustilaginoidea virens]